ncbi:MAG: 5'-nucleotidase C-terminal domain-containing protein [Myxococcota bacterium]
MRWGVTVACVALALGLAPMALAQQAGEGEAAAGEASGDANDRDVSGDQNDGDANDGNANDGNASGDANDGNASGDANGGEPEGAASGDATEGDAAREAPDAEAPAPLPPPTPPPEALPEEIPDEVFDEPPPPPEEDEDAVRLQLLGQIIVTGNVAGELAVPTCTAGTTLRTAPFARSAGALPDAAAGGALVLDTGGLLARHGVAQFAARHDPEALAELASRLGYRALALGEADLGDRRDVLLARATALARRGIPMVATNLDCDDEGRPLCDALATGDDGILTTRLGKKRVAILSFLDEEVAARVGPDRVAGVRITPLVPSIRQAVRAARARPDVDLVVAIVGAGSGDEATSRIFGASAELDVGDRPDLLLAAGVGDRLLFARPRRVRPAVIAPAPAGGARATIRQAADSSRFDVLAEVLPEGHPAPALAAFAARVGRPYCAALGQHLAGGSLDREISPEGFAELTAGLMRDATRADVALLNLDAVDGRWQPADPAGLTESDVTIALQYDEPLVVTRVPARYLIRLARTDPDARRLLSLGLSYTRLASGALRVKVNGRPIDEAATYRVVTVRFLAEGGDARTVPEADYAAAEGDPTIRGVVLDHLNEPREGDPRDDVMDPFDRLEWRATTNATLTFSGTSVRDNGDYQESPLTNANQSQVGINLDLRGGAHSRFASWDNTLGITYTLVSTDESSLQEGTDVLLYETTGAWRGPRARKDELYVPDLFLDGQVQTELTAEDDVERFLRMRFTTGPQWRLHLKVIAKLKLGFEVLDAIDADLRRTIPGFGAQLTVNDYLVATEGVRRRLVMGGDIDYFASLINTEVDPESGANGQLRDAGATFGLRQLLRGRFNFAYRVNRFVNIGFELNLFALREGRESFSVWTNGQATFGLSWTGRSLSY